MHNSFDILVIGGGPAGAMAAITAAAAGRTTAWCEYRGQFGLKLLATGGGRCNLTNILDPDAMAARFGAARKFVAPALRALPGARLRDWFQTHGVPTRVTDGFHVFPVSERAADVRDALLGAARELKVTLCSAMLIPDLAQLADGRWRAGNFTARAVILATGGIGYPELGGTGGGYELARAAGYSIVPPVPALCALECAEKWTGECRGVVLDAVTATLPDGTTGRGELLFTHRGVSGPAILDISGCAARALAGADQVSVRINFLAEMSPESWRDTLRGWRQTEGKKLVANLLAHRMPAALAAALCPERTKMCELAGAAEKALIGRLTALPLTVTAVAGWRQAMVTAGGVARDEVNPRTLCGLRTTGCFFAGEVLDVDGPCGGYNLTWAFASGRLAGACASNSIATSFQ